MCSYRLLEFSSFWPRSKNSDIMAFGLLPIILAHWALEPTYCRSSSALRGLVVSKTLRDGRHDARIFFTTPTAKTAVERTELALQIDWRVHGFYTKSKAKYNVSSSWRINSTTKWALSRPISLVGHSRWQIL